LRTLFEAEREKNVCCFKLENDLSVVDTSWDTTRRRRVNFCKAVPFFLVNETKRTQQKSLEGEKEEDKSDTI